MSQRSNNYLHFSHYWRQHNRFGRRENFCQQFRLCLGSVFLPCIFCLYLCSIFVVCQREKTLSEKATRTRAARQRPQFGFLCQRLEMFWNNKWFLTISDNWKKKRNKLEQLDLPYEWLFGVWHDPRIIWCSWLIIYEEWPILHKSACRN